MTFTLNILSATSNNKYSFIEILHKWFIMTGSTVHNLGVVQLASQELYLDTVPPTLLCNAQPF